MFPIVILTGGLATRMRPITEKIPKAMLEVAGKPFIAHQLDLLRKNGIQHVILCVGHLGEMIEEYVKDGSAYQLYVEYSYDGDKLLGTGGAIKNIGGKLPDDFFVLYGDSYLDIDYKKVADAYHLSKRKALMTVFKNEGKWDSSNVLFMDNELVCYSKKNKTKDMNYIDYGLGILNKSVFNEYADCMKFDLADVYEKLSKTNELLGFEAYERFYEIGSLQGLDDLRRKLR